MIILCTAREFSKWDLEFIHIHNIYYDRIISRPTGNITTDWKLKQNQLRYLFTLPQYKDKKKIFYDDNGNNLFALADLGAWVVDAKQYA